MRDARSGETISLEQLRGRPIVINVWASWCAPCVAELASFEALKSQMEAIGDDADVAFVFLSPERAARVAGFAKQRGLTLPFYVELDRIPDVFDVRTVPTTIVIDRAGEIALHHRGAAEWNTPAMRRFLRELPQ